MNEVDVVLANNDRVTLRVGETFLKVDADRARSDREVQAMQLAPVPVPDILWRQPPVLALAAVRGQTLGRLGEPSSSSAAAWEAVGRALRTLHDAPPPPWAGTSADALSAVLATESEWLVANTVVEAEVVSHNRSLAEAVLRPWTPAFTHGDLHLEHVFVKDDEVSGIIDWSEAGPGDALFDIASITLGNEEHLDDVLAGYGRDVELELVYGWWSLRCIKAIRWLSENGYGAPQDLPETALLRAQLCSRRKA